MQLGELEKQVLQYLWNASEADAKQVHAVLGQSRGNSLNTIQSTLDRLLFVEPNQTGARLLLPGKSRQGSIDSDAYHQRDQRFC